MHCFAAGPVKRYVADGGFLAPIRIDGESFFQAVVHIGVAHIHVDRYCLPVLDPLLPAELQKAQL